MHKENTVLGYMDDACMTLAGNMIDPYQLLVTPTHLLLSLFMEGGEDLAAASITHKRGSNIGIIESTPTCLLEKLLSLQ